MHRLRSALAILAVAAVLISSAQAANEVYKWTDEKGLVHYTDAPPEGHRYEKLNIGSSGTQAEAPPPVVEKPVEAPKAPKPVTQSNCEIARGNLDTFANSANVSMDNDGDGKPEALDATQRAKEVARNQELVKIYCAE